DIVRTPGTESNVKEIYDACAELEKNKQNVIINQFSEFPNYLIHYCCTGAAFDAVFKHLKSTNKNYRLAGFVAATGSAGTIAAGEPAQGGFRHQDVRVRQPRLSTHPVQ